MAITKTNYDKLFKVAIIESEAGWGSKTDEIIGFDTKDQADKYIKDYNDKYNNEDKTPDWYMVAQPYNY